VNLHNLLNFAGHFVDSQIAQQFINSAHLYGHKIYLMAVRPGLRNPHRVSYTFWLRTLGSRARLVAWTRLMAAANRQRITYARLGGPG